MNKYYLLYSDGTWGTISNTASDEAIKERVSKHDFPFPIDIKGDYRREVIILKDVNRIEKMKGI